MKSSFQADNPDKARHDAAKRYAAEMGQEFLTPLAARALFGLSPESVRTAARKGHVDVPFTLDASGRSQYRLAMLVVHSPVPRLRGRPHLLQADPYDRIEPRRQKEGVPYRQSISLQITQAYST